MMRHRGGGEGGSEGGRGILMIQQSPALVELSSSQLHLCLFCVPELANCSLPRASTGWVSGTGNLEC